MAKSKPAQVEVTITKTGKLRDPKALQNLCLKLGSARNARRAA
jgi:hypothetical protein